MGFFDVTGHTIGEDLSSTIVQQIANFQLDISFLRGQCYDGAGMDIILFGKMFYIVYLHPKLCTVVHK